MIAAHASALVAHRPNQAIVIYHDSSCRVRPNNQLRWFFMHATHLSPPNCNFQAAPVLVNDCVADLARHHRRGPTLIKANCAWKIQVSASWVGSGALLGSVLVWMMDDELALTRDNVTAADVTGCSTCSASEPVVFGLAKQACTQRRYEHL
jgi:hypothetical protein